MTTPRPTCGGMISSLTLVLALLCATAVARPSPTTTALTTTSRGARPRPRPRAGWTPVAFNADYFGLDGKVALPAMKKTRAHRALHRIPRCLEQRPLVAVTFMSPQADGKTLFGIVTLNARRTGRYCAMLVSVRLIGPPPGTRLQMGVYEFGDPRQPDTGSAGNLFKRRRKNSLRTFRVPAGQRSLAVEWLEPRFDDYRRLAGRGFLVRSTDAKYLAVGVIGLANPTLPGTNGE